MKPEPTPLPPIRCARCTDCPLDTERGLCAHPLAPRDRNGALALWTTSADELPPPLCPLRDYGPLTLQLLDKANLCGSEQDDEDTYRDRR